MKPIERFVVGIESDPWSAVYRVAIGFAVPPVFRALSGVHDSIWITTALFIGLLIGLRVVPLMLRYTLPFSSEAKEIWEARRTLSKDHESYAWQKLFWIGLGLLLYTPIGGHLRSSEMVVALFCLIGGGGGLLTWRWTRAMRSAQ
jgi:hypothetical protein